MKKLLTVALVLLAGASSAFSADVTNTDAQDVVLVVVEGESRMEIALAPGATESICPSGCFVTLPSGDRIGLTGGETVEISNGSATIK